MPAMGQAPSGAQCCGVFHVLSPLARADLSDVREPRALRLEANMERGFYGGHASVGMPFLRLVNFSKATLRT